MTKRFASNWSRIRRLGRGGFIVSTILFILFAGYVVGLIGFNQVPPDNNSIGTWFLFSLGMGLFLGNLLWIKIEKEYEHFEQR